jgi:MFS transporter, AAHS family, cis,cis-muconate transporter
VEINSFSRQGLIAHDRVWIAAFVFAFLGLMVDGADLMFLSYSLSSLKREFGLSNVEAGALGSITLAGMAIGGIYGGWACDRFGRVPWSGLSRCFRLVQPHSASHTTSPSSPHFAS